MKGEQEVPEEREEQAASAAMAVTVAEAAQVGPAEQGAPVVLAGQEETVELGVTAEQAEQAG